MMKGKLLTVVVGLMVIAAQRAPVQAQNCLTPGMAGCTYGLPTYQYQLLLTEMLAHPLPDVRTVDVDIDEIEKYSMWKVARQQLTFYDAPGGNPVGTLDAGFNYLDVRRKEGDWYEISKGKWVQASNLTRTRASRFSGVLIEKPLAHPMAWVLVTTRASQIPGVKGDENSRLLERYTRVNIFATVKVGEWEWYLVGPGQWIEQRRVARIMATARPAEIKGRWIAVDLYEQVLVAFDGDQMVFATLIASGLREWPTNEGLFKIWTRLRTDGMTGAMGQPDFYYLQSVPYVMYFDGAIGLHGAYWHDGFGYRHSHGCVNMSVSDARWLFEWTNNFFADAPVYVWASGEYLE